ncbi:MAG: hypothetical protein FWF60_09000, partial [Oscillospiraceae bacterium]|nr:hypothetical protein [Oscillospiraceae bacterium]
TEKPATAAPSKAAFERALELYKYFSTTSMQVDREDTIDRNGVTYYRVTQPEYLGMEALALALTEVFSYELERDFLSRTVQDTQPWNTMLDPALAQAPLYVEADNYTKLYTCMGDRGNDVASYSVGMVSGSESEGKIVSKLSAVMVDGTTKETFLTQELLADEDRWVFTDFPLDW